MQSKSEKIYNGKYIKLSKIGGGSFGQVYLVKDIKTNKEYAMKKFYSFSVEDSAGVSFSASGCVSSSVKSSKFFSISI